MHRIFSSGVKGTPKILTTPLFLNSFQYLREGVTWVFKENKPIPVLVETLKETKFVHDKKIRTLKINFTSVALLFTIEHGANKEPEKVE